MTLKTCAIMQYLEHVYYGGSVADTIVHLKNVCENLTNVKTYAIIIHDRDVLDDGTPKKPHFHIVLTFSNSKTVESIAKSFDIEPQYIEKIRSTTNSALLYLIHRNAPLKYQYPVSDVVANFDYAEKIDDIPEKFDFKQFSDDIANGKIKQYNIYEYIDVANYQKFKRKIDIAFEYRQKKLKGVNRNMDVIYIYGEAGAGKTTFAKLRAKTSGYAAYISSGGKNPLDDYQGEECIILDDLRGDVYRPSELLKLLDNNTNSLVGCRFYNRSIAECKLLIITSVKSPTELYKNLFAEEQEPLKQLLRRISTIINVTPDYVYGQVYDDLNGYTNVLKMENPVDVLYPNNPHKIERMKKSFSGFNVEIIVPKMSPADDDEKSPF